MAGTIVNFESHTASMEQNIQGIMVSADNLRRVNDLVATYRLTRNAMIFLIVAAVVGLATFIIGGFLIKLAVILIGIALGLIGGFICFKMKGGVMSMLTIGLTPIIFLTGLRDIKAFCFIQLGMLLISAIVYLVKLSKLHNEAGRIQP